MTVAAAVLTMVETEVTVFCCVTATTVACTVVRVCVMGHSVVVTGTVRVTTATWVVPWQPGWSLHVVTVCTEVAYTVDVLSEVCGRYVVERMVDVVTTACTLVEVTTLLTGWVTTVVEGRTTTEVVVRIAIKVDVCTATEVTTDVAVDVDVASTTLVVGLVVTTTEVESTWMVVGVS